MALAALPQKLTAVPPCSQVLALIDPHGTGSLKYEEVDYVLTQFAAMEAGGYE
jgi:hypothetical protein